MNLRSGVLQLFQHREPTLNSPTFPPGWLDSLLHPASGSADHPMTPAPWRQWVQGRGYSPLLAPATTQHRSRAAQEPAADADRSLLQVLWSHFRERPIDFEPCAGELFRLNAPNVDSLEVTRASRDGGRDATGHYAIGPPADRVRLESLSRPSATGRATLWESGKSPGSSAGCGTVSSGCSSRRPTCTSRPTE